MSHAVRAAFVRGALKLLNKVSEEDPKEVEDILSEVFKERGLTPEQEAKVRQALKGDLALTPEQEEKVYRTLKGNG